MFRFYGGSLKQAKDLLPHRDYVMEFDVQTNTKELEKNLKLLVCPSDPHEKFKEVVIE